MKFLCTPLPEPLSVDMAIHCPNPNCHRTILGKIPMYGGWLACPCGTTIRTEPIHGPWVYGTSTTPLEPATATDTGAP